MSTSLANASLIVKLNISLWTANSRDRKASAEVVDENAVQRADIARVYKSLLPTSKTLKELRAIEGKARMTHYKLTAPWSDNGDRILPITLMDDYIDQMNSVQGEFRSHIDTFLSEYEKDKNGAAFMLGELYNVDDYPAAEVVRQRFSFSYCLEPLPTSDDFRVALPEKMGEMLKQDYERASNQRLEAAMKSIWDRVYDTLSHLRERLTDDGTKANIFRNTMLENAQELVSLLSHLNVAHDPKMEHARAVLERQLIGIDSEDLRMDGGLRARIVDEVSNLMSSLSAVSMMRDVA